MNKKLIPLSVLLLGLHATATACKKTPNPSPALTKPGKTFVASVDQAVTR